MDAIVFILLAAVLIGAAFYLVALPLVQETRRRSPSTSVASEQERLTELLAERDAAFQALRELNFDYSVGKITEDDFTVFEANLKQHAAQTLRALDQWEASLDLGLDSIMKEAVLARKAAPSFDVAGEPDGRICAKCGRPALIGDRFCGGCGATLPDLAPLAEAGLLICSQCGHPHLYGDRFCARCGQALAVEVAPAAQ